MPFSFLCYLISAIPAFFLSFLFFLHMFQLNSYKPRDGAKWLRDNLKNAVLPKTLFAFAQLPFLLLGGGAVYIASGINLLYLMLNIPKKAKKPLQFTARVKRLIFSALLFAGAVFALSGALLLAAGIAPVLISLLLLFPYLVVLLANAVNAPVESAVRAYYIRDAKRILASKPTLTVIGITGSYGKTSVKFFLSRLLSKKYNVLMTPESYNTPMGVVRTIRESLRAPHEIFLCEMGAKNKGDIKELCEIVTPKHGIITSIGPQHLESFKTVDAIGETKFELYDCLPPDGIIFLNADSQWIAAKQINKRAVYYGVENKQRSDFLGEHISVSEHGTDFTLRFGNGESVSVSTKLIGRHNVINLVGCAAAAYTLGVSPPDIVCAIRGLEAVPHRLQVIGRGPFILIDDAFNSNPSGAKAALDTLSEFDGIKILVTPGMIELGAKQREYNFMFGEHAAAVCDYVLLVGGKITDDIKQGLLLKNFDAQKVFTFASLEQALDKARTIPADGKKKIVLLENDLPDNY